METTTLNLGIALAAPPEADGRRTLVQVEETGIPPDQAESVAGGWTAYWEKLNAHLRDRRVDIVERFVERYKNEHDWDCVDEFVSFSSPRETS